jgi:solute carrier family 39 (zinc transporter), member 9
MAIMLHKAPSSFGLASYLLHQGYTSSSVQRRLAVFSSSAPLAALFTYTLLSANLFAYTRFSLALCLLFSGGTFLYVATAHILPEIQAQKAEGDDDEGDRGHGGSGNSGLSWGEIGILLGGLLLPLLLNGQHGH